MSTSGIMIMIVLILCLELLQRSEISASASPPPAEPVSLQDSIDQLQQEIEELERRSSEMNTLIQSAAQMTASEMEEQLQNIQTVNRLLSADRDRLQEKLKQLQTIDPERSQKNEELQRMLQALKAAQRDVARMNEELESEPEEDRPIFSLPRGERRSGWIVDVADSQIQAAPIGRAERPRTFASQKTGLFQTNSAQQQFLDWAMQMDADTYFFLFVRPGGAEAYEAIAESFDKASIPYGFDLADPTQLLLNETRGAGE